MQSRMRPEVRHDARFADDLLDHLSIVIPEGERHTSKKCVDDEKKMQGDAKGIPRVSPRHGWCACRRPLMPAPE